MANAEDAKVKAELARLTWVLPDHVQEPIQLQKNGESLGFSMAIGDTAAFIGFARELGRHVNMLDTLRQALDKFQAGEANYTNAAENLDNLTKQLLKLEGQTIRVANSFWNFTTLQGKDADILAVKKAFEPDGALYLEFMGRVLERFFMTEIERKNL